MKLKERLDAYERLMRLDQPIGALLLMWPAMWALWLAKYNIPDPDIMLIFIVGVLLTRSAGCIINDLADRRFDPHVERTRNRPLAAGLVSTTEAVILAVVLLMIAFGLVLYLDRLAIVLSFVGLAIMVIYPFLKRVFVFPQAWLGLAFGWAIPMAFAAQYGKLVPVVWALLLANVFWAIAYDTEYAMVDRDDDRRLGVRSSAIALGAWDVTAVMACYAAMLALLAALGARLSLPWPYFAGLLAAGALAAYHWFLIRGRGREACFRAFLHNNWIGAAVFAGLFFSLPIGLVTNIR